MAQLRDARPAPVSDVDMVVVVILVAAASPVLLSILLGRWLELIDWLVAHHVLASAATDPILVVPRTDGAGLDLARICIVTAIVALVVVAGVWSRQLRRARAEQRV